MARKLNENRYGAFSSDPSIAWQVTDDLSGVATLTVSLDGGAASNVAFRGDGLFLSARACYSGRDQEDEIAMRQITIVDITIDAVIEREGPWRRPQDFFPAYDEATFQRHLRWMEPEVFDAAAVKM